LGRTNLSSSIEKGGDRVKKYTFTSILILGLGILFIIMTILTGYLNSISRYPDTSNIEAFWILFGLSVGIGLIVLAIVRTYRKLED
jgi:putative flippase GtrA